VDFVNAIRPSYLNLLESGELEQRASWAWEELRCCELCPWKCRINRLEGKTGVCRTAQMTRVASYTPHFGEERVLSGTRGSGTVFFSRCTQRCVFCQNAEISQADAGEPVSAEELAAIFLDLQAKGCHNINLVTPSHLIPQILAALLIAARNGLHLPLVYNTGGYDLPSALRLLEAVIDIYLPDLKYGDPQSAHQLSGCKDYVAQNQAAVIEMQRQVGPLVLDQDGLARRGLIARHLVLPNGLGGTRKVMQFLSQEISADTAVSLLDSYHPDHKSAAFPAIHRAVTPAEMRKAAAEAQAAGLHNFLH
jgi:putative pyruvate formate lyase activating enzyme